jgi:hypothetical protein
MKLTPRTDHFQTNDLPLASTLVCLGYCVSRIDNTDPRRVAFCFPKSEPLEIDVERFWNGEVRVEPKQYSNSQKTLKARIYSE